MGFYLERLRLMKPTDIMPDEGPHEFMRKAIVELAEQVEELGQRLDSTAISFEDPSAMLADLENRVTDLEAR